MADFHFFKFELFLDVDRFMNFNFRRKFEPLSRGQILSNEISEEPYLLQLRPHLHQ